MDRSRLEAYLATRLGEPVRVATVAQAFPGLSRETWLVTLSRGTGSAASEWGVVIRVDAPGGPFVPVLLSYEWQVYEPALDAIVLNSACACSIVAPAVSRPKM